MNYEKVGALWSFSDNYKNSLWWFSDPFLKRVLKCPIYYIWLLRRIEGTSWILFSIYLIKLNACMHVLLKTNLQTSVFLTKYELQTLIKCAVLCKKIPFFTGWLVD